MIVLGADTDKSSHTIAAIDTATGRVLGDKTVAVGARGFAALVIWARGFAGERVWALEDCRHVPGALERFLIARGERLVVLLRSWARRAAAWVAATGWTRPGAAGWARPRRLNRNLLIPVGFDVLLGAEPTMTRRLRWRLRRCRRRTSTRSAPTSTGASKRHRRCSMA